ncbi:HEAT repeat domain-containing protein [Pseudoalteromonas fenneropenaei]|uniref:HEAT repeat domain-containing protein n=1 Tax=Pseudoalteromonas fenneropenaei TaxID=1737459 RepID=A0ABV7CGF1_9GAMM
MRWQSISTFILMLLVQNAHASSSSCARVLDFTIDTQTTFAMSGLTSGKQSMIELKGRIALRPVTLNDQPGWWGAVASDVIAKEAGHEARQPDYEIPFAFLQSTEGTISQFWFAQPLDEAAEQKLKGLAYLLQWRTPKTEPITVLENDTLGQYQASYQVEQDGISMQKLEYVQLPSLASSALQKVTIAASKHLLQVNKCGVTARIGSEQLTFKSSNEALDFTTIQQYQLKPSAALPSKLLELPQELELWPKQVIHYTDEELARLQAELDALMNTDLTQIDAYLLAQQLAKYEPILTQLATVINAHTLADKTQMRLLNALGILGSDNAKRLLVDVLASNAAFPETQFRALRALAHGDKPFPVDVVNKLAALITQGFDSQESEMRQNFYLTLGIILKTQNELSQVQALHDTLTTALQQTGDEEKQAALLGALGNSGKAEHLSTLKNYVNNHSARVSTAAIKSLGRLSAEEAKTVLFDTLNVPRGKITTKATLSALGNFQLTPAQQQQVYSYAKSNDETLRYTSLLTLARQQKVPEALKQQLRTELASETSKRNFKTLIEIIEKPEQQ